MSHRRLDSDFDANSSYSAVRPVDLHRSLIDHNHQPEQSTWSIPHTHLANSSMLQPRSKIWSYINTAAVTVLASWSTYCTVRYFVAFALYSSDPTRHHISLALALTSLVSLLLLSPYLFRTPIPLLALSSILLLLLSSIANLTLTILSVLPTPSPPSSPSYSLSGRCTWDIDLTWSGTGGRCTPGIHWGWFIGGAIARVVLTLFVGVVWAISEWRVRRNRELEEAEGRGVYADMTQTQTQRTPGISHSLPLHAQRSNIPRLSRASSLPNLPSSHLPRHSSSSTSSSSDGTRSPSPLETESHTISPSPTLTSHSHPPSAWTTPHLQPPQAQAQEEIRFMGTTVRRMSTIESVSSMSVRRSVDTTSLDHRTDSPPPLFMEGGGAQGLGRMESFVSARSDQSQSHSTPSRKTSRESGTGTGTGSGADISRKSSLVGPGKTVTTKASSSSLRGVGVGESLVEEPSDLEEEVYVDAESSPSIDVDERDEG